MRMGQTSVLLLACLLAAGCSGTQKTPENVATDNGVEKEASNATANNATAPADPLAAYVGKYPFDKVDGKTFYEQPVVKAAVAKAVADKEIAALVGKAGDGPAGPIALIDGKVSAWACEAHNCGDHQWTIMVDGAAGTARVCYHDAETMQDQSRWYDGAGGSAMKAGECPSEDAG
jgi:hypothetical protein